MPPTELTPVASLVELQRKMIATERAAIVAFIRRHAIEWSPAALCAAIERGAHLYDNTLFQENSPCQQQQTTLMDAPVASRRPTAARSDSPNRNTSR